MFCLYIFSNILVINYDYFGLETYNCRRSSMPEYSYKLNISGKPYTDTACININ